MATYITETYYKDTYLGNLVSSEDFDALALRASAVIDRFTFNRADAIITADLVAADVTGIKMATCAVMEELFRQDAGTSGRSVKSESVGGHSVSYGDNPEGKRTLIEKQREAARLWLENTYLMFGGFYTGEYGGSLDDLDD